MAEKSDSKSQECDTRGRGIGVYRIDWVLWMIVTHYETRRLHSLA